MKKAKNSWQHTNDNIEIFSFLAIISNIESIQLGIAISYHIFFPLFLLAPTVYKYQHEYSLLRFFLFFFILITGRWSGSRDNNIEFRWWFNYIRISTNRWHIDNAIIGFSKCKFLCCCCCHCEWEIRIISVRSNLFVYVFSLLKQEVQILKALVLGEEERGQSQYQVMCFVTKFIKSEFISTDAMAKLRQVSEFSRGKAGNCTENLILCFVYF